MHLVLGRCGSRRRNFSDPSDWVTMVLRVASKIKWFVFIKLPGSLNPFFSDLGDLSNLNDYKETRFHLINVLIETSWDKTMTRIHVDFPQVMLHQNKNAREIRGGLNCYIYIEIVMKYTQILYELETNLTNWIHTLPISSPNIKTV